MNLRTAGLKELRTEKREVERAIDALKDRRGRIDDAIWDREQRQIRTAAKALRARRLTAKERHQKAYNLCVEAVVAHNITFNTYTKRDPWDYDSSYFGWRLVVHGGPRALHVKLEALADDADKTTPKPWHQNHGQPPRYTYTFEDSQENLDLEKARRIKRQHEKEAQQGGVRHG